MKLHRRTLLAGLMAASALVSADRAQAGKDFFFRRGRTQPPAPVGFAPGDMSITLRPNEAQIVDLSSLLTGMETSTNWIDLTLDTFISGRADVECHLWPQRKLTTTRTRFCSPRQLTDHFMVVASDAFKGPNLYRINISCYSGANGTGSLITKTCTVTIADPPPLTYALKKRTPAGYGGYPIHKYLPGSPGDWYISSQSVANALQIVNADNTVGAQAQKRYVTWNGTYGSSTLTVGTPGLGTGAYTVTLQNDSLGGLSYTISFDVADDGVNCAPNPLHDGNSGAFNQLGSVLNVTQLYFGDTVVLEDGDYGNGGNTYGGRVTAKAPIVGPSGQQAPTSPYASGWEYEKTRHPGWVTITSREGVNASVELQVTGQYLRVYKVYIGNGGMGGQGFGLGGNQWLMFDHCEGMRAGIFGSTAKGQGCYFILDNWLHDADTAISDGCMGIDGLDCQVIGNVGERYNNDFLNPQSYASVVGNGRQKIMWNVSLSPRHVPGSHVDGIQFQMNNSTPAAGTSDYDYWTAADGTEFDLGDFIGNTFWHGPDSQKISQSDIDSGVNWGAGVVTQADLGKALYDMQGYFMASTLHNGGVAGQNTLMHRYRFCGNCINNIDFWAIDLPAPSPASVANYNLKNTDYGVAKGGATGTGNYPGGYYKPGQLSGDPNEGYVHGTAANLKTKGNLGTRAAWWGGTTQVGTTNVLITLNYQTYPSPAEAYWKNCYIGSEADCIQELMDGLTSIGTAAGAGPFGDRTLIDHAERTYDATRLFATS